MELLFSRDLKVFVYVVKRLCENKVEVVVLDEREGGFWVILNFGYIFGYVIEVGIGYGGWLYGEVVFVGMVMVVDMFLRLGWIDEIFFNWIVNLLKCVNVLIFFLEFMDVEIFKIIMVVDKKVVDGLLRFIFFKGFFGNCVFMGEYDWKVLDEILVVFCKF